MRIDVLTIFPDYLAPAQLSLIGRAVSSGTLDLRVHDLREWATDRHRTVDDTPFGGGPGMVMLPEVWGRALDDVLADVVSGTRIVVPTPSGTRYTQNTAEDYAEVPGLVIACGRYEGIDDRVWQHFASDFPIDQISIGDYVLAGGEAAALVVLESVGRLLPGVLGNEHSANDDSFATDRTGAALEGPVYTKPRVWRDLAVPDVLLTGDHGRISAWRAEQSRQRTTANRPDLSPQEDVAQPNQDRTGG